MLLLVKGYIFSGYRFDPGQYHVGAYLLVGATIGLIGAWVQMGRRTGVR